MSLMWSFISSLSVGITVGVLSLCLWDAYERRRHRKRFPVTNEMREAADRESGEKFKAIFRDRRV